jgi:hypothetical protein
MNRFAGRRRLNERPRLKCSPTGAPAELAGRRAANGGAS